MSNAQNAHSTGEWSAENTRNGWTVYADSAGDNKHGVAMLPLANGSNSEANAAHIVQCVNSYPHLLNALEQLARTVENEREVREQHFAGPRKLDSEWKAARMAVKEQLENARKTLQGAKENG